MRTALAIALLSSTVLLVSGCHGNSGPIILIGGLEGGMLLPQVQEIAERANREFHLVNDYSPGTGHRSQRWQMRPFDDRTFSGDAELDFFDSRLVSVSFFPEDGRRYLDQLSAEMRIPLDREVRSPSDRRVRIRTGLDYRGKVYATWEDRDLRDALDDWMD